MNNKTNNSVKLATLINEFNLEQIYIPEKETEEDMTFESLGQGLY